MPDNNRLRTEERIAIIKWRAKFESPKLVTLEYKNKFKCKLPTRKNILALVRKFNETGSDHDLKRPGKTVSITSA